MPILKPLPIAGACLLIMLHATAQNSFDIIQHKPPVRKKLNWVVSWNAGIFNYHKNYATLNVDLPYTSTDIPSGNTTAYHYKTALVNFFTRPVAIVDILSLEAQTRRNRGYLLRLGVGGKGFFNYSVGYEWIIPLSKSHNNDFVFKPSISICIYQFTARFDSTIDNNQKIINIGGKTFGDTFSGVSDDEDGGAVTRQSSYLKLSYMQLNTGIFPQLRIARQSARHKFYYSLSVGWLQNISDNSGVFDIYPKDAQGHKGDSQAIPINSPYNFSGLVGSLAIGFYFHRT